LLEKELKYTLSKSQILFRNEPLEVVRHGKEMRLKDFNLKSSDNLYITEAGITITVVNPQVRMHPVDISNLLVSQLYVALLFLLFDH